MKYWVMIDRDNNMITEGNRTLNTQPNRNRIMNKDSIRITLRIRQSLSIIHSKWWGIEGMTRIGNNSIWNNNKVKYII